MTYNEMVQKLSANARCVVCGKPHPTDFALTGNNTAVYFHKQCFISELPKETIKKLWREL